MNNIKYQVQESKIKSGEVKSWGGNILLLRSSAIGRGTHNENEAITC